MASGDMRAAHRYSKALFNVAVERNDIDAVSASLATVSAVLSEAPQLLPILTHPLITRARKRELLAQMFAGTVHEDVQNFLYLLVEKDRAAIIPDVANEYSRMVDELRRVSDVEVVSAVPLDDNQLGALTRKLESATGYTIRLLTKIDESILGGLVLRVGDKLIDGSAATQLRAIREQLKQVKVT